MKRQLNILHTDFHLWWGGQTNAVFLLARGLRQRGHSVTVATPGLGALAQRCRDDGITVFDSVRFQSGLRFPSTFTDVLDLKRLMREERFDIIHTHGSQDGWSATFARVLGRVHAPVIRTRHNLNRIRRHALNHWLYHKQTDRLIAVSEQIRTLLTSECGIPAERIAVVHSALDIEQFAPDTDGAPFREELGIAEGEFLIGVTARLEAQKGVDFLLDGFAKLAASRPNVRLAVVGRGSRQEALEEQAARLGIEGSVTFCGYRTDIAAILAGLDLFVLPSRREGFGISALEAMAMRTPVVATAVGGIPEIVQDGETGLLVPHGDVDALCGAIGRLIEDADLRRTLADRGRRIVEERFTPDVLTEKVEAVYQDVLAGGRQ